MKTVWEEFGFSGNPYFTTPLEVNERHYQLFTAREKESAAFLTMMDATDGAFVVVSGDIGIGKTSFVNAQQHLLASGKAGWGQTLVPCVRATTLQSNETATALAQRIVHDAVQNIVAYCRNNRKAVPKECAVVRDWLSYKPSRTGYQLTLGPIGVGVSTFLPPVADATILTWRDILEVLADQVREELDAAGLIVFLDNAETLPVSALAALLMDYRDHFLSIKGVWWVLIGQTGLYKRLDSIDRRVSQRISGRGVELSHLSADAFHEAIRRRVQAFRKRDDADSPLSLPIHDLLFQASYGEVRFVFDVGNSLVQRIIEEIRVAVAGELRDVVSPVVLQRELNRALMAALIDNRIPDDLAKSVLARIADEHMSDQSDQVRRRLGMFGTDRVSRNDFARFGFQTPDDFEAECERLRHDGFLGRTPGITDHHYSLKGYAWLWRNLLQ